MAGRGWGRGQTPRNSTMARNRKHGFYKKRRKGPGEEGGAQGLKRKGALWPHVREPEF